jgi:hypothetical protein
VLKVGMAFGGSMNFGNREGIARFGMGMKTAALSRAKTERIGLSRPETISGSPEAGCQLPSISRPRLRSGWGAV